MNCGTPGDRCSITASDRGDRLLDLMQLSQPEQLPALSPAAGQGLSLQHDGTHRQDAVSSPQLSTEVSRASSQDKGDEDPLSILSPDDVEAQSCGAFVQDDFPGLST